MAHHQLVNNSVYDRAGFLIGNVLRVEPLSAGNFSLVVGHLGQNGTSREIRIDNNYIYKLDSENNAIHVNVQSQGDEAQESTHLELVEEQLVVNRQRVKVGEVSIRRVVETEMVQVPIQHEKLVIERVGESTDPIEVNLNETRLRGTQLNGTDGGTESYERSLQAGSSEMQSISARGTFATIGQVLQCLDTMAKLPDPRCDKVRVEMILRQEGPGLKGAVYEFATPEQTRQNLSQLPKSFLDQCSSIRLELFSQDNALLTIYQDHLARYVTP
jgi:hypothetical protein